ncbi:MAG TPA: (Fe-S)-binding protein [Polyangiaceae bacterium]|nr:(Fe-S)-binding protein [Polyangiaceae bacterium]
MNPILMALIIVSLVAAFAWSARRRWHLLQVGDTTWESRTDQPGKRAESVWTFALYQKKMRNYLAAGLAHQLIFMGFGVLLLRTLILWGRGFSPTFNLFILGHEGFLGLPLGAVYSFVKDVFSLLVLLGASVFVYYRAIKHEKRMTLSGEGLLILGIIMTMMLADLLYDGSSIALRERFGTALCDADAAWCARAGTLLAPLGPPQGPGYHAFPDPGGSLMAQLVGGLSVPALVILAHAGFWTHSTLVLVFLNILPHSKHFHIITAIPNVYLGDLTPRGRLRPLAENTEKLMAAVEKATEGEDLLAARIGYARINHFSWKDVLDFYTCTECGRCSDNCPAFKTGKILSPKQFTLDLRNHLYGREAELEEVGHDKTKLKPVDLVPEIIHPDVLWACTTCRACEEQCPVNISYVDKIVQMRRNLVVIKGEFPQELAKPFEGMESNGNPWNLARVDRTNWAEGLGLKMFSEKPDAEVLFWVGCAASYDDRAKKIARSTAQLLQAAGVDFAILGEEETCTGDPARRAGNEYLFAMLAETNAATLNGYKEQGGIKKILTTCPHCFNTLTNEYPDFGAKFEVIHHTDYMLGLVAEKKLVPKNPVKSKVAYHDSCYLGRYNDIYESPRQILAAIPGVELVEVEGWNKKKGLCCGAGGAQMFMEEQNKDRVNVKRTLQLVDALGRPQSGGAQAIASACPFCMTMLKDGVKAHSKEEEIENLDVVELLARSCGVGERAPASGDTATAAE